MQKNPPGIVVCVQDCEAAASWLQKYLFFERREEAMNHCLRMQNENCVLYLKQGEPVTCKPEAGSYITGIAHVALQCTDIDAAIRYTQSQELELQLLNGKCFFNPQVFGSGEYYFNIISPYGMVFEVSRRADLDAGNESAVLTGLDHVGIPSPDLEREMEFFEYNGFVRDFEPVLNRSDPEGNVKCVMLTRDGFTLEIYSFPDLKPIIKSGAGPFSSLVNLGFSGVSPSGVEIIGIGATEYDKAI